MNQFHIPEYMMEGLAGYIEYGIPPGDFLYAVLCNDLMEACGRADDNNMRNLPAYAAFLYNEAPAHCYGSPERVKAWIARGGSTGRGAPVEGRV